MAKPSQAELAQFFALYQQKLVEFTLQAYAETGGHYAALSAVTRRQQALQDVAEFSAALSNATIDHAGIERAVQATYPRWPCCKTS